MRLPTTTTSAAILALMASPSSSAAMPEKQQQQQRTYPARTIYQFANNATWIENIAVRPNGNLMLTLLDPAAELHEIVFNNNDNSAEARLLHRFAAYQSLLGIAETSHDAFALVAGNYTTSPPSWALWGVDFTDADASANASASVKVNELVPAVPGGKVLNGLTTVRQSTSSPSGNGDDGAAILLMSDSTAGTVLRVTLSSPPGIAVVLPADNRTTSPPSDDPSHATGVNGVRYRDGYLYFANTYRELFCRVRVNAEGEVTGQVEVLAEGGFKGDDFVLRWEGGEQVAYVMDGVDGEVVRVVVGSGEKEVVALLDEGGEAVGVKPTAAAWGRRAGVDEDVLYVVTRDGKVLAVDLGS
ncbi:Six-bladed beta-propeller TolB-like protein [Lasiodiplodia theobromae]|nr:Six-bladed beta-propeller TolB-like protein [Lasiodiplodia theobromae]